MGVNLPTLESFQSTNHKNSVSYEKIAVIRADIPPDAYF